MFSDRTIRRTAGRILLGTIGAAALTACGGGGGGNVRDAGDGSAEVNTLLVSDTLLSYGGVDVRVDLECLGDRCTMSFQGESVTLDLDELLDAEPGDSGGLAQAGTRNGVPLGRSSDTTSVDGDRLRVDVYGGWLDASAFGVGVGHFESGRLRGLEMGYGMSIGNAPNTNPRAADGGATWRGAVVAVDTRTFGDLEGEVTLGIDDFANPDVDVEITGLAGHSAITWRNVPLRAGSFATGSDGNSIDGRFYGDTHQEAGGVFERDRLIGAFGAKRYSQ